MNVDHLCHPGGGTEGQPQSPGQRATGRVKQKKIAKASAAGLSSPLTLDQAVWHSRNAESRRTHPIGQKEPFSGPAMSFLFSARAAVRAGY